MCKSAWDSVFLDINFTASIYRGRFYYEHDKHRAFYCSPFSKNSNHEIHYQNTLGKKPCIWKRTLRKMITVQFEHGIWELDLLAKPLRLLYCHNHHQYHRYCRHHNHHQHNQGQRHHHHHHHQSHHHRHHQNHHNHHRIIIKCPSGWSALITQFTVFCHLQLYVSIVCWHLSLPWQTCVKNVLPSSFFIVSPTNLFSYHMF